MDEAINPEIISLKAQVSFYKKQLEEMEKQHKEREKHLKQQLDYALRSAEKVTGECDRAVELAERMKFAIESNNYANESTANAEQLLAEIQKMRKRNQKYSKSSKMYFDRCDTLHDLNQNTLLKLSSIFSDQLEKTQEIPIIASPIIKKAQTIDGGNLESLVDGIKFCFDIYHDTLKKCISPAKNKKKATT